jgi:hypothetical protein
VKDVINPTFRLVDIDIRQHDNVVPRRYNRRLESNQAAERGIVSASADRRLWFGKNAYNSSHLAKLVEVIGVYFNYREIGKDKCTPAMRMGLARELVVPEDILYFVPREQPRRRARAAA